MMPPNGFAVARAAIEAWLATSPPSSNLPIDIVETDRLSGLAHLHATHALTIANPDVPSPPLRRGSGLQHSRRQPEDGWLLTRDIWALSDPLVRRPTQRARERRA